MSAGVLLPAVHASVDALVARSLDIDQRDPDAPSRPRLTDRDLDILETLCHLRYLTTSMIAALAWGTYNSRLRDRLHALFHASLIRRFRPPIVKGGGGAQWVYELDTPGHRAFAQHRPDTTPPWSRSELYAFSYAEHDLELNALLCELAARAAAHTDTTGPLWHAAPFRILGPRASRIDPDHETRPSDADPINQLPIGHVVRPGTSQRGVLEPDATLLGRHATTDQPISVLIEYDRTRRATKLIAKLARYDHFLTDGWRRTRYAHQPDEPAVLFITRTERHLPNAIREADHQLTASIGPSVRSEQARYPGREELAFTSRDRLIAADDTIVQVPERPAVGALPPGLQGSLALRASFAARRPTSLPSRSIDLLSVREPMGR